MKSKENVLLVLGSPRKANTYKLAHKFNSMIREDFNVDFVELDNDISPCQHCGGCSDKNYCVIQDSTYDLLRDFHKYDTVIFASSIYFFHLNAQTKSFLDRLYSQDKSKVKFGTILVSGSGFFEGGADLVVQSFKRMCNYCGSIWLGSVHKQTNDKIVEVNDKDIENLLALKDSISAYDNYKSTFIQD